jgi:Glycosyltransferase family 87
VVVATFLGCALYVAAASSPTTGLFSHRFRGDTDDYHYYAERSRHEVPIRDFQLEYPPASLVVFLTPLWAQDGLRELGIGAPSYAALFKAVMLICGFLIVLIVVSTAHWLWRDHSRTLIAGLAVGLSPLALGPTALSWYDVWPTLLAIAAVAFFVRGRLVLAFALLGLAIGAKLFAVVLLPILLAQTFRSVGRRRALIPLAAFVATTAVCFGTAAILSLRGARYPFSYLLDRPVEIESSAGSIVGLLHIFGWLKVDTHVSYGSLNFEGSFAANLGLVIAVVGAIAVFALWWRSAAVTLSHEALIARCTAAIAIAVAASKVLSPQYMVWLVPFVVLAFRRAAAAMLTAAVVLTRIWFPERWHYFNNIPPLFGLAAARNLAVCLLAVTLLVEGTRSSHPGET